MALSVGHLCATAHSFQDLLDREAALWGRPWGPLQEGQAAEGKAFSMSDAKLRTFGESLLGTLQVAGTLLLSPLLRAWYNHWGATEAEVAGSLPGDDLVPSPLQGCTRAVTIHAPAAEVWPWLVQMGQGRGGLYSYEGLENLAGCRIRNTDRVLPEFQDLKPGDLIRLGPQGYPCFTVWDLEPARFLALVAADPKTGQAVDPTPRTKGFSVATWQFYLDERADDATRLVTRQRLAYSRDLKLMWRLVEPVDFVMGRKMLLGVKERAERRWACAERG